MSFGKADRLYGNHLDAAPLLRWKGKAIGSLQAMGALHR